MSRRTIEHACPACGNPQMDVFFEQRAIPTNSCLLLDTREEAEGFPRGDLELGFCHRCGFLSNVVFDAAEYSQRYEETQGFSKLFVEWAKGLAARWVDKYDLHGKRVLEIGCGKGEFLVWMVEAGAGHGIGIDPGVHPERIETTVAPDRLTWIKDFYSEDYSHLAADAVVCRHTLEHIHPVGEFMRMVRAAIGDRPGVRSDGWTSPTPPRPRRCEPSCSTSWTRTCTRPKRCTTSRSSIRAIRTRTHR